MDSKPEGVGWVADYVCRLLVAYHQYSFDYILYELPMIRGWILYSWAYSNDALNRFGGVRMVNGGYLGYEADKLYAELKEIAKKQNFRI